MPPSAHMLVPSYEPCGSAPPPPFPMWFGAPSVDQRQSVLSFEAVVQVGGKSRSWPQMCTHTCSSPASCPSCTSQHAHMNTTALARQPLDLRLRYTTLHAALPRTGRWKKR